MQYTSIDFGRTLRTSGVMASMDSIGDAFDNAMAESFFATLKEVFLGVGQRDSPSWVSQCMHAGLTHFGRASGLGWELSPLRRLADGGSAFAQVQHLGD